MSSIRFGIMMMHEDYVSLQILFSVEKQKHASEDRRERKKETE